MTRLNSHRGPRPRGRLTARLGGVLTLAAGASLIAMATFGGVITTRAAGSGVENSGVFELDGNIAQDAATPPPYDWACVFPVAASATCPPPSSLMLSKVFQADYVLPDATTFASSNKDIDDVSSWQCGPSNNLLAKDDIQNGYGAAFVPTTGPKADHLLLFLAQERASNNGDSFAGFWLMQHQHACVNGSFSNGGHDVGDLLVVSNYTNGGSTATVQLYQWNPASPSAVNNLVQVGSGFTCGMSGASSSNDICGIANSGPVTEPWAPNHTLAANSFVEVGIDATDIVPMPSINGDGSCFSDFLAETRSSQQLTATLKDFTTAQFHFCVAPTVSTMQSAGGSTSASMTVERGTGVTDQATLGAPLNGTPGGTVTYRLYSDAACSTTPVFSSGPKALTGGVVPPSDPTPGTLPVGGYQWQASYSGDVAAGGHNSASTSGCGDEPLTILDASITVTPQTATNAVGAEHTFTITASVIPAATHLDGATITTSVSPAPSSQSSTCSAATLSANTATCTLTINSTSVTTYTVNASATLGAGGISMVRSTSGNHGPSGGGPATKSYVDASVAIASTAVNEVDHAHTFTITVTADPGSAGAPAFGPITTSVSPTPDLPGSSTCGSPTVSGNVATCTLTIDSSTNGTFTANAAATVSIAGVVLHRSTDGSSGPAGPAGSGPAIKRYVDAAVSIGVSAVNPVNQAHVFTIVVTALPGSASPVSFGAITPSVTPAPGTMSDTCATPTVSGNTATCTLTVNSSLPDTFAANVSAVVTMGGVTVTRSTSGNSGPGGSGPATKTYVDASVGITPGSAVNEVGHPHTFTVTVTALPSGATPVLFTSITPSVTPTPDLASSSTCATPQVTGDTATCTVTIDSSTAGIFTVNATAAVSMGGVTVTRTTAGYAGPAGTGPATKTYVDASVAIGPSAVNPVGSAHIFTVTVTAIPAGATPVGFGAITPSVSPVPGSLTTTCGSPSVSGNTATCTVTVNSTTAGTFTANATAAVTMGGVTVTRSTSGDHGPGGSGPATKTYVDGSISITPATAVNEVGNSHTFTITATAIPSGAAPVGFTSITATVSPAPTSQSSTCAAPVVTGSTATCTLTIDSTSVATYTANATAVIGMGGVTVTRSTSGDHGPGGSGPAVKCYVDAAVSIGPPTAINVVGAPHVFTVTVTALPGGVGPTSFDTITPSVTPAPSSLSTTCGSPVILFDIATCTVTIDSTVQATYTANVSAQVTMGGVTVTRSTSGDHGPGGSGPATKTYGLATIAIAPDAVNAVGDPHTFTVTVTSVPGTVTSVTSITTSVTPAPGSSSTTCGSPTVVDDVATCTVTIDSTTAGAFTATATAKLVVNGFATSVTTDGTGGSSGPAVKTYVDASIAIAPTAVNEVGHDHTFTITVDALPAGGPAATFTGITPVVTPAPGSLSTTCGTPTVSGNRATCTVTIDSGTAGLFTANAAAVVSVGDVTLHRSTDAGAGPAGPAGSGPAFKTYVDAAVGIGPSAVNPIGREHVFDIVVTAIPAGADPVSFGAISPVVTPAPLSSSTTCDTPAVTGDQATCTLTITSDLPATFAANVTAQVTMGGVTVTRSTAENHGPGGTGPATKTYVNALITLTPPVATDPVGDTHTLTATVTRDDGSGSGARPVPDGTVVSLSVVSGPGTLSSATCTTSGGDGTCTDTLTSPVAGTTTIHATVTVTVEGVSLVRSTGDSVPGDGPDATKTWVKVTPAIATTQSAGGTTGIAVSDTATVTGGLQPTGTVTFQLFAPGDTGCTGTPVYTDAQEPLTGGRAASRTYTTVAAGTLHWVATYSGDAGNVAVVSGCGEEPVTITSPAVVVIGLSVPATGAGIAAVGWGVLLVLAGGILVRTSRRRRGA